MSAADDLQRLDLVVGRIVAIEPHQGARAPSYLLTIGLGSRGERKGSLVSAQYNEDDLLGSQVVCAVQGEELLLLGVHSHAHGVVLLRPDREVEDGSAVA